jgi:hypothetical protein
MVGWYLDTGRWLSDRVVGRLVAAPPGPGDFTPPPHTQSDMRPYNFIRINLLVDNFFGVFSLFSRCARVWRESTPCPSVWCARDALNWCANASTFGWKHCRQGSDAFFWCKKYKNNLDKFLNFTFYNKYPWNTEMETTVQFLCCNESPRLNLEPNLNYLHQIFWG